MLHEIRNRAFGLLGLVTLALLVWVSQQNFLMFHALAEMFAIAVAAAIFMLAWNARRVMGNGFLLFVGIAYLFVAILDLVHTLAFRGMGLLGSGSADPATQLWIAARYIQAGSLLAAPLFLTRRLRPTLTMLAYAVLTAGVLASIFLWDNFPTCYVDLPGGGGYQTQFKIVSEYVISGLLIGSLLLLLHRRRHLQESIVWMIGGAIGLTVLSELAFTQYAGVYEASNVLGHLLKIVAFYLVYRAVIVTGLTRPYELLFRDLTNSQQALARSERRLRRLADANIIGVLSADAEGRVLHANDAYADMLGYSRGEIESGQVGWRDLTPPEFLPLDEQAIAECRIHGACTPYQKEYLRRDGQRVPVLIGYALVSEDEQPGEFICFVVDLTAQKHAEAARRQAAARLSQLLESISDAFVSVDEQWRFTYVNDAAARMLGRSREEMLGQAMWQVFADLDGTEFQTQLRRAMDEDRRVDFESYSDRLEAWLEVRCYPSAEGLSIFFTDTTARKKAEEQLRHTAEELARSNRDLEQFAYVASHDLQEPLRMVTGYMDLIQRRYADQLDDDAREFIGFAADGATRMKTLIQDLLAYSRVGTRGKPFVPIDLAKPLAQALEHLQVRLAENGAEVTHDPLPTVLGDQTQLTQLFLNLIGNAIKFRSPDRSPRIHVSAQRGEGEWTLCVEDNGIGIEPQYLERIFIIFQRLHARTDYPGTGIGLALCKRVVDRHGGRIWAKSTPGQGSRFCFALPDHAHPHRPAPPTTVMTDESQ